MKRQKLEDGHSSSSVTGIDERDSDEDLIDAEFPYPLTPFTKIVRNREYVDKSLFIKTFLEQRGIIVITAPSRFVKTTNLDMLKYFLEIEVNSNGFRRTLEIDKNKLIKDTPNYTLFTKQQLKITQEKEIMRKYFGKYPVMFVNMSSKGFFIFSFTKLLRLCRKSISLCFKQHDYLLESNKLNIKEKEIIKKWCCSAVGDEASIINGLKILSICLYKHFKTKVFILIDAYDDPIEQTMCRIKCSKEFHRCIELLTNIYSETFNNNNSYIKGGLFFGVVYISDFFTNLKNVKSFKFLDNHCFINYFGLSQDDANELFSQKNFELNSSKIRYIKSVFNGYTNIENNIKIYNLASVLYFLFLEDCEPYRALSDYEVNLRHIFKIPFIKKYFTKLLRGRPIMINIKKNITLESLKTLYNIVDQPLLIETKFITDLFFSVLLQIGFLTYSVDKEDSEPSDVNSLEIPNVQIYIHLKTSLCLYEEI